MAIAEVRGFLFFRYYLNKAKDIDNTPLQKIIKSIEIALCKDFDEIEQRLLDNINQLRKSLKQNHSKIEIIDYGAVSASKIRNTNFLKQTKHFLHISKLLRKSQNHFDGTLLYSLIKQFRPQRCIELGTNIGISAIYQSYALQQIPNSLLVTCEGAPQLADLALKNFEALNINNVKIVIGAFADKLQATLEQYQPIDFFFNDGHHSYEAVLNYLQIAIPYFNENCLIVIDDIRWSVGMFRAWKKIQQHPNIALTVDLGRKGICVYNNKIETKYNIKLFINQRR